MSTYTLLVREAFDDIEQNNFWVVAFEHEDVRVASKEDGDNLIRLIDSLIKVGGNSQITQLKAVMDKAEAVYWGAGTAWYKADTAYDEAGTAYDTAHIARSEAKTAMCEVYTAYCEADTVYCEAETAYDEAKIAYDNAVKEGDV